MKNEVIMPIEKQVRDYIMENLLFAADSTALANDDSFLEKGIIDSTGILELIFFLEQQFEIKVYDTELIPENLDSVSKIVGFVQKKKNGG
jgi:acyl carrier protein